MNIGDFRTRRKVTGKFYFAEAATPAQFRDYGNVLLTKAEPKYDRAQQMTAQKGYVQVTHEEPGKVELKWSLKVDEHADDLVGLLHLANGSVEVTQTAESAKAWSITSAQRGYSYYVGDYISSGATNALGLTAFAVTSRTEGTDYTIDKGSGMLSILPASTINNVTIAGTLTKPELKLKKFTSLTKMFVRGAVRLHLFDQNSENPREIITFNGELYVSDWGEHDGQKFNEVTLMLLATSAPVVQALELD